ncbi:MAG: hypothetical protein VKN56_07845, partial [Cyanobacteriota bacterium]|nr:hypothetical protein [Cyanobacteriota bacterium]
HNGESGCAIGEGWPRQELYRQCLAEVESRSAVQESGRGRETLLRQASRRRRQLQQQGGLSPRDLED